MKHITKALLFVSLLGATLASAQNAYVQHVIVVVQENRTPDNLFGSNPAFMPGADIAAPPYSNVFCKPPGGQRQQVNLIARPLADCYGPQHGHKGAWVKAWDSGNYDGPAMSR